MACNLEISMSCVTEAEDEGRSCNASSLEMHRYRKSRACMFDQVKGAVFQESYSRPWKPGLNSVMVLSITSQHYRLAATRRHQSKAIPKDGV